MRIMNRENACVLWNHKYTGIHTVSQTQNHAVSLVSHGQQVPEGWATAPPPTEGQKRCWGGLNVESLRGIREGQFIAPPAVSVYLFVSPSPLSLSHTHTHMSRVSTRLDSTSRSCIAFPSHRYTKMVLLRAMRNHLLRVGVSMTVLTDSSKQTARRQTRS